MLLRVLSLIVLFFFIPIAVESKEIKYNHNSLTVSEVKEKVDFPVLVPDKIPDDWTLEIKTYPMDKEKHFTHFRLHYMDKDDKILKVGIEQRKEPTFKEEFSSTNSEDIDINGNKGFFKAWGNSGEIDKKGELVTGGLLSWTQDGIYVQMNSSRIPKEMLIDIAISMKVVR